MGHTVILAVGVSFSGESQEGLSFERLMDGLQSITSVSTYFQKYTSHHPAFYLMKDIQGYEETNKVHLFPSSSIIWTVSCDGSVSSFFHAGDGLENPEGFIDRIRTMREDSQRKINEICDRMNIPSQPVQIIRFTETYE